jgi:WD40 repeat protein
MRKRKVVQPKVSIDCDMYATSTLIVENNKFFIGSFDLALSVYDIDLRERILKIPTKEQIESLAVNQDYIFAAGDGFMGIFDKLNGELIYEFEEAHSGCIHSIILHETVLISGCKEIKIFDLISKKCIATLEGHGKLVQSLVVKDGYLIAGYDGGIIIIWDLVTYQIAWILHNHELSVTSLLVTDELIISGSGDGTIKIWDFHTGKLINTLLGQRKWITSIALHKDYLFSGSNDGVLKIWNLTSGVCTSTLQLDDKIKDLFIDSRFLYSISDSSLFHQWDLTDLVSEDLLEAVITNDYIVKNSCINRIYFVMDKYK